MRKHTLTGTRHTVSLLLLLLLHGTTVSVASETGNLLKLNAEQIQHLDIHTVSPEPVMAAPLLRATARVVIPPEQEFVVSAPQPGLINKVDKAIGTEVRSGEPLAWLSSPELIGLQRDYLQAQAQLQLARQQLNRAKTLFDEGIGSRRALQESQSGHSTSQAAANAARQSLLIAGLSKNDIARVQKNGQLATTVAIRAPLNGTVLERMVVAGQRVDSLTPLYRIGRTDTLWLEIDVPYESLAQLREGDLVTVEPHGMTARVTRLNQQVEASTQTAIVRALLERSDGALKPGQVVNVKLARTEQQPLLKIPTGAVTTHDNQTYVFVKLSDGFRVQAIEVAGQEGNATLVRSGLSSDEAVVVQGLVALKAHWQGIGGGGE